jgi:hypothetical protein
MEFNKLGCLALALWSLGTAAQIEPEEWKESETPPPPAFSTDRLIPLAMPPYVTLQFGVDPGTLAIGSDGLVRYVVVARNNAGSTTAIYEGLRCVTGEVKTYARQTSGGPWVMVKTPQWQALTARLPSKHAAVLAHQGVCDSQSTTANSVAEIVKALKR